MSEILWEEKKHFLDKPWSFTGYTITPTTIYIARGVLNKHYDELKIYRIMDISVSVSIIQKICGTGTIYLYTIDRSTPTLALENIPDPFAVRNLISELLQRERQSHPAIIHDNFL